MHHQKCLLIVAGFFAIYSSLVAGELPISGNSEASTSEPPFVIHYGLNDSHSRNWVRENSEGMIGITYFQLFEGSDDEGTVIYREILPDGSESTDSITTGRRLEKSVLLYDALDNPHIFIAQSNETDQLIDHYYNDGGDEWLSETIIHFYNEGGKFIYELSADKGPDGSFHLLILKSRSDVDSDDFMDAWINSFLYYLTNATGSWEKELIHNYDMAYTYDMCIKSSIRQDIEVDSDGYVHVTFGEQKSQTYDPSILRYATNTTGTWEIETALSNDYGLVDDAGWFPSLCLDNDGVPYISCIYLNRVLTHSVMYSKLLFLKRLGPDNWYSEVVAEYDDGYYGSDGRDYTGALCHLVFDRDNTPHVIFSDIAATHWDYQRLNVGNIRYGVFQDGAWNLTTIYRQPLPTGFFSATEMLGMCLVVPEQTNTVRVIGQEIVVTGENEYTCGMVEFAWPKDSTLVETLPENEIPQTPCLSQNYPNPFNPHTTFEFSLPARSHVEIDVFNLLGQRIRSLHRGELAAGTYSVTWNGCNEADQPASTGIYLYRVKTDDFVESKKMMLVK